LCGETVSQLNDLAQAYIDQTSDQANWRCMAPFYVPDKMKPNIIRLGIAMAADKAMKAQNSMEICVPYRVVARKRRHSLTVFARPPAGKMAGGQKGEQFRTDWAK
jgi:hypothetical protein